MIGESSSWGSSSARPMRGQRAAACFVLLVALALQCFGLRAELQFHPTATTDEVRAVFTGDISRADVASAQELGGLLKSGKRKLAGNAVGFASNGGDFEASLRLGRLLRELGLSTVVAKNDQCMSACVFAFMGGERRLAAGKIGIHRPYFPSTWDGPERQVRYRALQKSLRQYIDEMDYPPSLYEAVMIVPPEAMQILAAAELKRFYLDGISPSSEDTADATAARRLNLTMNDYLKRKASEPACALFAAGEGACVSPAQKAAASGDASAIRATGLGLGFSNQP
jgi:hypothetical protein